MAQIDKRELLRWCRIPMDQLIDHPDLKIRLRLVADSEEMGRVMARELVDLVKSHNARSLPTRAIVPCGPTSWYAPFRAMVNAEEVSLRNLHVFHMDECLDWQGRPLPRNHPHNFRAFMEAHFYGDIRPDLAVPESQRHWLYPETAREIEAMLDEQPADIVLGGWGQDGHVAYNQARRHPYSTITVDELRRSSIRIQENNWDTIIALAQRGLGSAYQFVPPMSITLGMKQILSAKKVRVFSDTGAWKQTALRVALFGPVTAEYPITLLQEHPDALITATRETARHPISEHPEWELLLEE